MSELPNGWCEAVIADVTSPFVNVDPKKTPAKLFKYVDIGSIDNKTQTIADPKVIKGKEAPSRARRVIQTGDTLFSTVRTYLKNIARVPTDLNGQLTSTGIAVLRPNKAINPGYLFNWVCSDQFVEAISVTQDGTMYPAVSDSDVADGTIRVPPLPEQGRIVSKIDSLSAKSRSAREDLDHIPRLVEKYKQAILAAAFRGELTMDWRRAHQNDNSHVDLRKQILSVRDGIRVGKGLRAKGRNRSVPTRIHDLPPLPSAWEWMVFEECAWDLTVGHVGPMKDRYVSEGIPFLRSLNIRPNRVDLKNIVFIDKRFDDELAKSRLRPGDLVVVRTGEPGVAAVVPEDLKLANCSDLVIGRLVQSLNPHYAAFFMNSEFARQVVRSVQVGVAQQHFNVGAMSEMPIPVPTIDEQSQIVRNIQVAFDWIDRLASETNSARKLIDHLDQAILTKAFRGELVPQDPNDEPASVLLERIKAARSSKKRPTVSRRNKTVSL